MIAGPPYGPGFPDGDADGGADEGALGAGVVGVGCGAVEAAVDVGSVDGAAVELAPPLASATWVATGSAAPANPLPIRIAASTTAAVATAPTARRREPDRASGDGFGMMVRP